MLHHQQKSCNDKRQPTFLESERLRQEIEDLEDALILHARFQSESDNSVKEMIRKELGTTHWEHGGEGKLTTYRSGKDMCNQGMKVHHFCYKKAKDRKKQCAVSGDQDDGRPKIDRGNSEASTCASADKQVRKLKKVKSTLELRDIMSDVEKMSELKITSIKATAAIKESRDMTFDTADVKQGATMKTPSLKDEISAKRKVKSSMKIRNYSSKLYVNTVERKQSKDSYNNSIPESSNVLDTCKITAKEMTKTGKSVFDKKAVSHLFTQDTGDNFKSGIQSSFNSSDTNNVVTKSKLKTQELDGRKDTDKTLMSEAVNNTNVSDSNTFINDLLNNDYEYSKSNMLVGNVCNKNNRDDSRFLSSNQDKRIPENQKKRVSTSQDRRVSENQDQRVDKKDKWAEKNTGVLFIDSDYIRVPCSSCTDDGGGDNFTDFDALEDPQTSLHEGYEHACLSNPDSCQKDKQQNETNEKMLSFTDSFNMFSTTRKEVQPSVTSQTNIKADNVNISSELVSSLRKCLNYEQVDSRSLQAVSHTDMSVIQQGIVSDISSSLPETEFPQGKPSHDEDVESWLHSLGLDSVEHYVQLFHDHQLDMSRVHFLSASDLREMGIHGIGPIMKIMKGVLVLGRDKGLICGSSDYTSSGDKQRLPRDTDATNMDNHIDTRDLTEMSTKCSHGFSSSANNNNMCKLKHGQSQTCQKVLTSPVLHTKEPGQGAVVNSLDENKLSKQDLGTTGDLKISDGDSDAVDGVSYVVEGVLEKNSKLKQFYVVEGVLEKNSKLKQVYVVEGVLEKNSKLKQTPNQRQALVKRRAKQPVLGVSSQLPVNSKGIAVTAHKSHMKEKMQVKETNGRSMRRQKQLQDSEFSRTSVGQRNEKAGLDITSLDVCKVQSDLNVLETQSAEPNIQTLQQHCLDENSLEMPRCLQSVELGQVNNYRSDSELASPISATRRNSQERKQQKDNTRSSHVIAEDKPVSVKVYTNGDDQSHKLPGQGQFRRVNESLRERNSQNLISCVAVGDGVIAINSAEIQKETTVAQPVTLMATTHLLKSQRSRHSSARSKDNGQIRRQQSRQSEKYKRVGSSPNYILDSIKKVELNRNDVVFSETDLLGSGTFSQVFKGTYKGSEVAVKRLQIPLQTRDLSYFVSGISILQELRHPHVAMLLGVCSRGHESPLIVMEFLACGNLHTWLHAPGRTYLKRDEFYQIAHDVSAGMLYLHHHQPAVLHLDLKPKNILIGHGTRAKVADFGFTKLRLQDDVKPHRTLESPSWMAPELFTSGEITPKADVYSFAMVLWEMLTRQCPYDNFSIFQILEHVHTNRRPTLPSDCPKGLSQIIQKCWSQKPAARPGFKEILKCLEQLSQICEWITSSETAVKPGNEVMSLNCTQEYSRITEYSLKEGLLKAEEKTSDIDHIDLISLSSQDYEESKSCNDDEGECLQDPQGNVPERSRFCDTISLTDIRNGIHAFNDRKSSLSCTDVEQQRLSSQFSCNSSRSCLSLPDNEKDSGKMRHNTPDQLNEMCFISQKPSISVSKSQDNLQSSMSVRKLLPLRHSLNRSKIMQASLHGKRCTPQRFLNHQTKSQIGHHFLDENLPDRMFKYVDTSSDSMKDPALVGSRELMKGQDTLDCISVNEDELLAPCSDTLNYVPSFHDKVAPVRLTTGQEASELQAGCCHESSNNDQHGNDLKELLICSHVETQSVNMFMKSQRENIDCASIKAHEIKSGACDLDTDSTKRCRMHVMKIDSQTHIVSPLGQSTMCSVVSNTHKSKQLEADTHHFLDNNIAYEKENSLDRKMADVCLPASSTRFSNIQTSTKSSNIQASTKSKNIQTASVGSDNITASPRSDDIQSASVGSDNITASPRSDDIQSASVGSANITTSPKSDDIQTASVGSANITTSPRSDDIQSASVGSANITTSPRSDDIQNASVGSNNITTSSAPDDIQTSTKSGNIPTHYVKCYSPQIPVVPENVHIPSSRSNNIQALDTPGDTDGFNEVIKNCTEPNNYRTPSIHAHETTTYESDSDSSTVSDISQDSLNKDTAVRPRAVRISDHGVLTRSSALAMTADIILKNKIHNLPIADDKNTEISSAYNPCLTCKQGLNAHHTCLQSEQENINNLTELSSIDAEAIKFNKIHNTDDHRSLCLWSEGHKSYHVNSFALTKSHAKTLQEEMLPREKQKPNLTEPKKDPQVEEAAKHYLMTIPSCQKRNFLTERQLDIGNHTSDMAHKANKAKDILPLHSKQIFKHSEGTSRFSIDANILLAQKKLLKPVVVTASSLSVNTLDDSEGRSPTVITILKKAMTDRRFAMGDILGSQDVTPETSWSLEG